MSDPSAKSILLKTCQALFAKDLTDEETDFWAKLLQPIDVPALRFAFDNWNRSGQFFPKPADILEQVKAFNMSIRKVDGQFRPCGSCENGWIYVYEGLTPAQNPVDPKIGAVRRCQCWNDYCERVKAAGPANSGMFSTHPFYEHYGQGYGLADVRYLFDQFRKKRKQLDRPLNPNEIEALYKHLDEKRGEVPYWRRPQLP